MFRERVHRLTVYTLFEGTSADGQWELKKGRTIPAKITVLHRTYTVINVTGNTVVAQDADTGAEVIVELRFEPSVDLTGHEVTFIGRQIEAGRFVATKAVTLSKVVERLRVHVEKERSVEEGRGDAVRRRVHAQKLAALKTRLERHVTKQIDRLTQLLVESPEEAKAELHRVQDNIKKHLRAALAVLDKTPEDVDRILHRRVVNALVVEGGVNVEANHITLLTPGHAKVIVAVVDGTQIQIGKEPATIKDIKDIRGGDHVRVQFDRESGDVARIEVRQLASSKGLVDSVDFENGSITFRLPDSGRLTLTVSEVGKVQINGHLVPLENLLVDTAVHLSYNPRTLQLLRIEAKERSEHTVTVITIDKRTRTIVGRTDDGREVRLRLAADARLEAGNIRGSINALRVGARVTAVADRATQQVVNLREHVSGHRQEDVVIRGRFTGIRTAINTLTLSRNDGAEVTLTLAEDAEVLIGGEPAQLADIDGSALIDVIFNRDTLVALKVVARRQHTLDQPVNISDSQRESPAPDERAARGLVIAGIIVKVDAEHGVLVLFTERRVLLELKVNHDSHLLLNGHVIKDLSQITRGAEAKLLFDRTPSGNIVDELRAHKREVVSTLRERAVELKRDETAGDGLVAAGTIEKVDAERGVLVLFTERQTLLQLRVNHESHLFLNGHAIEDLGLITRGAEAKLRFHRTLNGNIVDELHAQKREVVSTDETGTDGQVAAGTIEKVDAEHGVLVVFTERQTLLQLKVNHESLLFLNGHAIEDLGPITRGAEAKLRFHRTLNGNIVDELHAQKREVVSTLQDVTTADGLVAAGTIEKVDAEHGVLVVFTERQTVLQLRVNHESLLFLNGHAIEDLGPITRGAEAKLRFHRTLNGNIVDELHAQKREVVSTLQDVTTADGLVAAGTIEKVDAEHGVLVVFTERQTLLQLKVNHESHLFLNGHAIEDLGLITRGAEAKLRFHRTLNGNIVDELHAQRGYVNRCVNDIRRRPSQPLIQWRFHPHTVHRDRRLRSTQGPSDA